jgi:2-C-methyl-D-erythritol 4-phosphate cytidylyltransferase/2-C-methyl-D-erythritol 2,4-cyclodiphosphate synthase
VNIRVGSGFDAHAFDSAKTLWLAGLEWLDEPGLRGHSDGDAVIHAIVDALLGAAGLGDIGSRFGTDEPQYQDAPSKLFLEETLSLLAKHGWVVGNVSAQLIGEHPRFSARRDEAQSLLTHIVGAPVSVSATTTDGMGFTGRGEGVAVYATALIFAAGDAAAA